MKTDERMELVRRWRDVVQQLELARNTNYAALVEELAQIESAAMQVILRETEGD